MCAKRSDIPCGCLRHRPPPQLRCTVVSTCVREGRGTHFVVRGAPGARSVCASVSELCVIQSQRERRPVRDPQTCVRENNYWYKRTITHTLTYTRARARAHAHIHTRAHTPRRASITNKHLRHTRPRLDPSPSYVTGKRWRRPSKKTAACGRPKAYRMPVGWAADSGRSTDAARRRAASGGRATSDQRTMVRL